MIICVYFTAGAGGDGFANLLEHCHGAVTADGLDLWRIHRIVDGQAKFWAPCLYQTHGRVGQITLSPEQQTLASDPEVRMIMTSHDLEAVTLDQPDQISVLVKRDDAFVQAMDSMKKNLIEYNPNKTSKITRTLGPLPPADLTVDIDQVQHSWDYVQQVTRQLGLVLDRGVYDQYMGIVSGKWRPETEAQQWISRLDPDGVVRYQLTSKIQ